MQQNRYDEFLEILGGEENARPAPGDDQLKGDLMDAAFEALLLGYDASREEWERRLLRDYYLEVHDALSPELSHIWNAPYTDRATGTTRTIEQWANIFADPRGKEAYYAAVSAAEARRKKG